MRRYWWKALSGVLLGCLLMPLVTHVYLGSYSRFIADDFCSAAITKSKGIWGRSVFEYLNWTGRFSVIPLDSLMGYLGPGVAPYSTAVVVTVWFAILVLTLYQLLTTSQKSRRLYVATSGAAAILFTTLDITPLVAQSLYWGQGMRAVVPPLILGTAFIALLSYFRRLDATPRRVFVWSTVAGALTLVAGGFAETYVALQTSALIIALIVGFAGRKSAFRERLTPLLVAALVGSLIAMTIIFIAPGNKVRQAPFPPPPGVLELLKISSRGLMEFFEKVFLYPTRLLSLAGLVLSSAVVGAGVLRAVDAPLNSSERHVKWSLIWLPLVSLLLLLSCNVPIAYGASLTLPNRTLIIPAFVLVCALAAWGYMLGRFFEQRYGIGQMSRPLLLQVVSVILLSAFAVRALNSTNEMLLLRPSFRTYAKGWDEREKVTLNARRDGATQVAVPLILNWALLDEVGPDPNSWVNQCVRDYYGLTVVATPARKREVALPLR
jgi:hypothetical protein